MIYLHGPGNVRQVIAAGSPVCHTLHLSLSTLSLPPQATPLTLSTVCLHTHHFFLSLPLFLTLPSPKRSDFFHHQYMSSHVSPSWCTRCPYFPYSLIFLCVILARVIVYLSVIGHHLSLYLTPCDRWTIISVRGGKK